MSVLVCTFTCGPRLHHLVLRKEKLETECTHPFLWGLGTWESVSAATREHCNYTPASRAAFQGRCCLMLPASVTSFPFTLAAARRFLKETLCRVVLCLLYLHTLFCSMNPRCHFHRCRPRSSSTLSKGNRALAQPFALSL